MTDTDLIPLDIPAATEIDGDKYEAENFAVHSRSAKICAIAERAADLAAELEKILAERSEGERQVAEFLSLFDLLRYLTKIFEATAPYGVDASHAANYATLHAAATAAYNESRQAIKSLGGTIEYPISVTHPVLQFTLDHKAAEARAFLEEYETTAYIDDTIECCGEDELVCAAMYRLNVGLAMLSHALKHTKDGDALPELFGNEWLDAGTLVSNGRSLLKSVINFSLVTVVPLTGPNCLLQVAVELAFFQNLLGSMRGALEEGAQSIHAIRNARKPASRVLTKEAMDKYLNHILNSFGKNLSTDARAEFEAFFRDNRRLKSSSVWSDTQRRDRIDELLKKHSVLSNAEGMNYPKWVSWVGFLFDLYIVIDSTATLYDDWDTLSYTEAGAELANVFSAGLSAAGSLLLLKELITEGAEKCLGKLAAIFAVVSSAIQCVRVFFLEDKIETEEAIKAVAAFAASSLLLVSSLTAGTMMSAFTGGIGGIIMLGLVVYDVYKWLDSRLIDKAGPALGIFNSIMDRIDSATFTSKYQSADGTEAVSILRLSGSILNLRNAMSNTGFFGLPPVFPLYLQCDDPASDITDFESFCDMIDYVVPNEASRQAMWDIENRPSFDTATTEATLREECAEVLTSLHVPADVATTMFYYTRATIENVTTTMAAASKRAR